MWIWTTVASALFLGLYDVFKKQSLKKNDVLQVLLCVTAFSTLLLSPWLSAGPVEDHLKLFLKAILVSTSWISGLYGIKLLPLTTASTIKATRPVFVLVFSVLLFGERLNGWQWAGSILAIVSLYLLSLSSRKEGIQFSKSKGILFMAVSVLAGSASALYDKHIIASMEPLFVQSWCNFYITMILAVVMLFQWRRQKSEFRTIRWDWLLLLIAVLIVVADFLYFYSLKQEGAMISIISMVRRSSVLVPFLFGIFLFKEKNIRGKALALGLLLCAMALLVFGTQ